MLYAAVTDVTSFLQLVQKTLASVVPVLVGVAVVFFLFGLLRYIQAGDKPEGRADARKYMLFGVIALFVMVSVWGLVNVLAATLGLNNASIPIPQF